MTQFITTSGRALLTGGRVITTNAVLIPPGNQPQVAVSHVVVEHDLAQNGVVVESAAPPTVYMIPTSIDSTGATDVTNAINNFITTVPDGANSLSRNEIRWQPSPAVYKCNGTINLSSRNNVNLNGNGATILQTTDGTEQPSPRTRSHIQIQLCTNSVISNFTCAGANPNAGLNENAYVAALEAQHGVCIRAGTNIEVVNNHVHDVYGDFFDVESASPGGIVQLPNTIYIHNNFGIRNGRQGISLTAGNNLTASFNNLDQIRRTAFDLEPPFSASTVNNVLISQNTIGKHRLNFVSGQGTATVNNVTVDNNKDNTHLLIVMNGGANNPRRSNWKVTNNQCTNTFLYGSSQGHVMAFWYCDGVTVTNNHDKCDPTRITTLSSYNFCTSVTDSGNTIT